MALFRSRVWLGASLRRSMNFLVSSTRPFSLRVYFLPLSSSVSCPRAVSATALRSPAVIVSPSIIPRSDVGGAPRPLLFPLGKALSCSLFSASLGDYLRLPFSFWASPGPFLSSMDYCLASWAYLDSAGARSEVTALLRDI